MRKGTAYMRQSSGHMRRLKRIGVVLVALVIGHGLVTGFLGWRVRSEIAKLRASGQPVTCTDLAPKAIPDSENGAVLYAKAFRIIQPSRDTHRGVQLKPEFRAADSAAFDILNPHQFDKIPAFWAEASRKLSCADPVFALCQQAMARPRCQFPIKLQSALDPNFAHLGPLRLIVRLASAKAVVEAHAGNARRAAEYLDLAFRTGNSINKEPALISALTQNAMVATGLDALEKVLCHCNLDARSAALIDATISRIDLGGQFAAATNAERAFDLDFYRLLLERKDARRYLSAFGSTGPFWAGLWLSYPARPLYYRDELVFISRMDKIVRDVRLPYRALSDMDRWNDVLGGSTLLPLSGALLQGHGARMSAHRDYALARIAIGRTALALAMCKSRFGGYPQSIRELESKLGRKMPADPFAGESLVYKQQGSGFMLYSLGQNMKDDRGRPDNPRSAQSDGDIVMQVR